MDRGAGIDPDELERVVTPRTRGIMINTPANTSGKVFSRAELEWLADYAVRHQLFVFTDEIYEYFVYDGREHISPGSLEAIADQTITISGYSKTFSITGWRIGYSISHKDWTQMIGYINDLVYVCGPSPLQAGVARGINELPPAYYVTLCNEYLQKREKICGALSQVGLTPIIPQGSYYVLVDASQLPGATSKDKAMYLLNKTGIATVGGSAFYASGQGENQLRVCFAKSKEILEEACQRLQLL